MLDHIFYDFVHLFVIFSPVGIIPQYLYFTRHVPPEARRRLALRCVTIATLILVSFIVLGQVMLNALEISLPAFSIAGGLVLLVISMRMIFESVGGTTVEDKETNTNGPDDLAVFPLATPLIAGPGGILVVVLLTNNDQASIPDQVATTLVLLVVMALTYAVLLAAGIFQRILGKTGISVASRILGLVLAALSVQTILNAIHTSFSLS